MTQDELAAASGIDSSNIRAYENGRSTPSIHSLLRVATALNVEPGKLLDGLTLDHFAEPTERARTRRA
jgi:transcriptional regulator with XRE-family HTH domain